MENANIDKRQVEQPIYQTEGTNPKISEKKAPIFTKKKRQRHPQIPIF